MNTLLHLAKTHSAPCVYSPLHRLRYRSINILDFNCSKPSKRSRKRKKTRSIISSERSNPLDSKETNSSSKARRGVFCRRGANDEKTIRIRERNSRIEERGVIIHDGRDGWKWTEWTDDAIALHRYSSHVETGPSWLWPRVNRLPSPNETVLHASPPVLHQRGRQQPRLRRIIKSRPVSDSAAFIRHRVSSGRRWFITVKFSFF